MAYNDMHVVVFKILSYIYDCMKNGKEVDKDAIRYDALEIPESYWCQVVSEIVSRGYVTGMEVKTTTTMSVVHVTDPKVTLDGVEFLMSNGMMGKAAKFVEGAGGFFSSFITPFL